MIFSIICLTGIYLGIGVAIVSQLFDTYEREMSNNLTPQTPIVLAFFWPFTTLIFIPVIYSSLRGKNQL